MKTYCLRQVEGIGPGINHHRVWFCEINEINIYSNDDISGNRFYMTEGEQADTIWYPTPTAAAIAYNKYGQAAVTKTAKRRSKYRVV